MLADFGSMSRRKILYYASDMVFGGAWVYLEKLIRQFAGEYELWLIAHKTPAIDRDIERIKPYVTQLERIEPLRSIHDVAVFLSRLGEVELVHFNLVRPNICFLPTWLAKLRPRVKQVATLHLAIPIVSHYPFKAGIVMQMVKHTLRRYDRIIVVSEQSKRRLLELYSPPVEKVQVIYNGLDPTPFLQPGVDPQNKRRELDIPPGKPVISIIGRIEPQKGHRYAVETIHKLVEKTREFVVLIVGEGTLEAEIRAQINALGLSEYFKFLGLRTDIPELLSITDILLLTSLWEGLPFTVQEAMFAGVPVVASRVDGNLEAVVDGTTGYLSDYKNAEEIAGRLYQLLTNPSQRKIMGKAGQQRAQELFTLETMIKQTKEVYNSLLK